MRAIAAGTAAIALALGASSVPASAAIEPAYYGTLTCSSEAFYVQLPGTYTSDVYSYYSYRVRQMDMNGNFGPWSQWRSTSWFYSQGYSHWKYVNSSWVRWGEGFQLNVPVFSLVEVWTWHESALYKGWKYLGWCQA